MENIDSAFAAFLERISGIKNPVMFRAAASLSGKTREGHTCMDLGSLASNGEGEIARLRESLQQNPVVGSPGDYKPLILDSADRLYLHRHHQYQETVAQGVLARCSPVQGLPDMETIRSLANRFFPTPPQGETDWQKIAAITAVLRRLAVISGGPGTGKTTIAARIIALLLCLGGDNPPVISLATPTGKAAARLMESLERELGGLDIPGALRDRLPSRAVTIHRLLGARPDSAEFVHNARNPLATDVLIVDEASMVDLALFASLVDALPPHARLILLGDKDQLSSVAPGSVLGDLCQDKGDPGFSPDWAAVLARASGQDIPERSQSSPLADSIVHLEKSYRFTGDSGIGRLARAVAAGSASRAMEALEGNPDICFTPIADSRDLENLFEQAASEGYGPYMKSETPEDALERFARFRILCGVRKGALGVEAANRLAERVLAEKGWLDPRDYPWYEKRPVVINRNDAALGLFNGDAGCLAGGGLVFSAPGRELRRFSPAMIPEHETAFAMTVHKSQGSEFDAVLFVLPPEASPVLTRELVYTAITRTRRSLHIAGTPQALARAIENPTRRPSGLADAVWGRDA